MGCESKNGPNMALLGWQIGLKVHLFFLHAFYKITSDLYYI